MNIVYLIGNGFDIAQGLPTSYNDFYQYLRTTEPVNDVEQQIMDSISGEDHEKWSDMEYALGEFTTNVSNKDSFAKAYYSICNKLRSYLISCTETYYPTDAVKDKYIRDLVRPDYYFSEREKIVISEHFARFSDPRKVTIVSFNYSDVIDQCLAVNENNILPSGIFLYGCDPILKIHGTLTTSYMLMGVNDPTQIKNSSFADDEDVLDYLVKPISNQEIGTRIEIAVENSINQAQIIVAMGLSFGATDNNWWKCVGKRITNINRVLVLLFVHENDLPDDERQIQPIKRRWRREFLLKCGIEEEALSQYFDRVLVCVRPGLFSPNTIISQDNRVGL